MAQDPPAQDLMRYEAMAQDALRGVVKAALKRAAAPEGLPGAHHFYITFKTDAPGVSGPAGPAGQVPGRDDHRPAAPVLGPGAGRDLLLGDPAVRRPAQAAVGALCGGDPLLRPERAVPAAVRGAGAGRGPAPAEPRPRPPQADGRGRASRAAEGDEPRSSPSTSSGRSERRDDRRRRRRARPPSSPTRPSSSASCAPRTSPPARRPWASAWSRSARPSRTVEVEFDAKAELLLNPMKQIQGGYLCAMLDECMSVACMVASGMTAWRRPLEMKTSFFRPGMPGKIRGVGRVVRWGTPRRLHRGRALRPRGPAAGQGHRHGDPDAVPELQEVGVRRLASRWLWAWLAWLCCGPRSRPRPAAAEPVRRLDRGGRRRRLARPLRRPVRGLRQRPPRRHRRRWSRRASRRPTCASSRCGPSATRTRASASPSRRRSIDALGRPDRQGARAAAWSTSARTARRQGVVVDQQFLPPGVLAQMLDHHLRQRARRW